MSIVSSVVLRPNINIHSFCLFAGPPRFVAAATLRQPTNQPFPCIRNTHTTTYYTSLALLRHSHCNNYHQTLLVRPDPHPERVSQRPTRRETFDLSALPHELRLFHNHQHLYSASPDYATHGTRSHSLPLIRRSPCQRHTMSSIITVPHSPHSALLKLSILTTLSRC